MGNHQVQAIARPSRPIALGARARGRTWIWVVLLGGLAACKPGCKAGSTSTAPESAGTSLSSATAQGRAHTFPTPVTLLQLGTSAYHTRLDLAADAIYLLTMDSAIRLVPGQKPEVTKLDLSDIGVATPSSFIYWSNGSLWLAPKRGGPPGPLAKVKDRPVYMVASGEQFAWIGPDEQGHTAVYVLRGGKPHTIHALSGTAAAATMVDDRVIFIERLESDAWRLGSVLRGGEPPSFSAPRRGRYPSMLARAHEVYYYFFEDKLSEVWAVSPDLRNERVVAKNVICSPLAAADRVFCGHMEGLFEISPTSGLAKLVYPSIGSSITTVAADPDRIVWVSDVGAEKLMVQLIHRKDLRAD